MIVYQVELSAYGSEIALLCQRGEGVCQLSWKTNNTFLKSNKEGIRTV